MKLTGNVFYCKTLKMYKYLLDNKCIFLGVKDKENSNLKIFKFVIDSNLEKLYDEYVE